MTWFELLLFVHVLAAMLWIGGAVAGTVIGQRIRRSDDAAAMGRFCSAFADVAGPLFGGSSMLVLASGVWMVALEGGPEFSDLWVTIGFVGWLASTVLGATAVGMTWMRIGQRLQGGASLADVQPLLARAVPLTWLDVAIRTTVVLVMVWRPMA